MNLAKAGLRPPVLIATWSGPRRTTEGTMKEQSSGSSTTLTGIPAALASS